MTDTETLFSPDPGTVAAEFGPRGHLLITVQGKAKTQGSKTPRAVFRTDKATGGRIYTGQAIGVDGKDAAARDALKSWRALVSEAATEALAGRDRLLVPVGARITFTIDRPRAHFGTGKNWAVLKGWAASARPTGGGDWDKLARAIGDSMKDAGVYKDDRQIVSGHVDKVFTRYQPGGWSLAGTNSDPMALCGCPEADALTVPGVVIRLWRMG